jgi:prepilin-type N-terminal cleavage/methylation domain-containing protein
VKSKLRSLVAGNRRPGAFTLIELLVVMAIILVLAGLILATSGYVQKKGARSRTEAEIAALSAALESYKADNGNYPRDSNTTDLLNPINDINPYPVPTPPPPNDYAKYTKASLYLYGQLSGDYDYDGIIDGNETSNKTYFTFQPSMLYMKVNADSTTTVGFVRDPFGNSYGYSTAYQGWVDGGSTPPQQGYNPTFDLWSTANYQLPTSNPPPTPQDFWIKNW